MRVAAAKRRRLMLVFSGMPAPYVKATARPPTTSSAPPRTPHPRMSLCRNARCASHRSGAGKAGHSRALTTARTSSPAPSTAMTREFKGPNTDDVSTGDHFVGAGPTRSARLNGRLRRSAPLTAWATLCPTGAISGGETRHPGARCEGSALALPGLTIEAAPDRRLRVRDCRRRQRRPSSPRDPAERSSPVDNTRAAARAVLVKGAKRRRRSEPLMRASTSPHWGWRWVRATV